MRDDDFAGYTGGRGRGGNVVPLHPHTAEWWIKRELQRPESLLGEVITSTARVFIGGPTGIGKSHLAMGMAAGMATGRGFAHWRTPRPVRVLYVDGEMARDLVQDRLIDLKRRLGGADLSGLFTVCREDFEAMEPLNTEAGQDFLFELIERWQIEVVIFDNRMSLIEGDMKDEEPWSQAMAMVRELTRRRVAQIWVDHTGHDAARIYGTKTKEWSFDSIALLSKVERPGTDIAFQMEFTKARRRRPDTRADFETVTMVLDGDVWTVEGVDAAPLRARLTPLCQQYHRALLDALCVTETPGSTTRTAWYSECVRGGLAEAINPDDGFRGKDRKQARLRKYMVELKLARLIGVDGEAITDLQNPRTVAP